VKEEEEEEGEERAQRDNFIPVKDDIVVEN